MEEGCFTESIRLFQKYYESYFDPHVTIDRQSNGLPLPSIVWCEAGRECEKFYYISKPDMFFAVS